MENKPTTPPSKTNSNVQVVRLSDILKMGANQNKRY